MPASLRWKVAELNCFAELYSSLLSLLWCILSESTRDCGPVLLKAAWASLIYWTFRPRALPERTPPCLAMAVPLILSKESLLLLAFLRSRLCY